ncbi:MAG: SpvB/TcaC N-terminal domain-containing protein [Pseudomonadota bacterium]
MKTQEESASQQKDSALVSPPGISLPKGGGAIKGIGEKFSANPVTGTGSMSVPIALSPGRSGFGPQLALSYDSGSGQSVYGLGWNLAVPGISRKTDKGLPRYQEAEESDVFLIAGAEDLVPVLDDATGQRIVESTTLANKNYKVHLYRPRIEGLFARIERWTEVGYPPNTFWRSLSRDNVTTWYGRDEFSRIFDPKDHARIYQWLLCETHDDKGNAVLYQYLKEDNRGVDLSTVWEANRDTSVRQTNPYLKRILYGNLLPYLPKLDLPRPTPLPSQWMFEAVFDYGDHHAQPFPTSQPNSEWDARSDPFSTHRAGFEIRTHRLCQRVLMFHHFPNEPGMGPEDDYLVRSTNFNYELPTALEDPAQRGYTVLRSVTQCSFKKNSEASGPKYHQRDLPPVEFDYSPARVNPIIQHLDPSQLENLPVGIQGSGYRWIDLNGEGLSGVLSEGVGGWYYKPNLGNGTFGSLQQVAHIPAMAVAAGSRHQFMDLAGDGEIDVVEFDGPMPGFHERDVDGGWKRHVPFFSLPNINWQDPNLRFIDLTGDGHADALITEHEVFTWYPSLEERGFAAAEQTRQPIDEDKGPHLVFADGTQTIFLADMCGDGLTDLVRIRNGEIAYWPNLGYGKFGRKVTLGNSPRFDNPDLFDPSRIRLTDIDGSGTIDIIYLSRAGARLYFNRSGNSVSDPLTVALPVATDNLGAVQVADLLGNGTACLVWNSHLPADAQRPVCYIDLMGGQKPHLLLSTKNNLGATTEIQYVSSTRFYLQDKAAGRPWITKLPFPVHVVEKVTLTDNWRHTNFTTTYSYHHGYFDGLEREFRGFGRVEQVDVEDYGQFAAGNIHSPYITQDKTLYQPPVKTITWFHTGAAVDRQRILTQFEREYFPRSLAALPTTASIDGVFIEKPLPEPELEQNLSAEEWREALRACKGMTLRQEVYELDVDSLKPIDGTPPKQIPVRLYSAATHNCTICRLQPKGENQHAVFLVTESEAISYHYELDLRSPQPLKPDPRIAHTLNLSFNKYGNVQQSVAVGYPRRRRLEDDSLTDHLALIREVQSELHIAYSETHYTGDVIDPAPGDLPVQYYRLRVPCEVRTYELTGINAATGAYFNLAQFRDHIPYSSVRILATKQYHEQPLPNVATMRLVEHARTLFFKDDLSGPLELGKLSKLGLPYEQYKLALTEDLLNAVFTNGQLNDVVVGSNTVRTQLRSPLTSGYIDGTFFYTGTQVPAAAATEYWMRSGVAGFFPRAADHFYLPEQYTDPFNNITRLKYDEAYHLFVQSSTDALGNKSGIFVPVGETKPRFDFRVLAPLETVDINGNRSEVCFDIFGMVIASAVKGKGTEADNLDGYTDTFANPDLTDILNYFDLPAFTSEQANNHFNPILKNASTRFLYHFGQKIENGAVIWEDRPAGACAIVREKHVASLAAGNLSPLQIAFECSDGMGTALMKRSQAEPEQINGPLRWIVSGKTVLNNKGKPVKQYEPYFSASASCCSEGDVHEEVGVTPIMYYDAAGRVIRTELPDGTLSRVEFSPWFSRSYDQNDTVLESDWYKTRNTLVPKIALPVNADPQQRAGWLAAQHANTYSEIHFDSLGREVISIAHNRTNSIDKKYLTFTKLDAEGKPLWIQDARGNLVMQYVFPYSKNNRTNPEEFSPCYDIAGNLLFQHSMDAGERWTINDAAGKPLFAWDIYQASNTAPKQKRLYCTDYDALHRPLALWLKVDNAEREQIERFEYQDALKDSNDNPYDLNNLNGQLIRHYDHSGLVENNKMDFAGNLLQVSRSLIESKTSSSINWPEGDDDQGHVLRIVLLECDATNTRIIYTQITEYDGLKRMTRQFNWHLGLNSRVAIYKPRYNKRGVLISEDLVVGAKKLIDGYSGGILNHAIVDIRYDAKGQREYLELGNDVVTRYSYDPKTFRLVNLHSSRTSSQDCNGNKKSIFKDNRVIQNLSYTYDPVGNITEIYDAAFKTFYHDNALIEPKCTYEYDALYRLIAATGKENALNENEHIQVEENLPCVDPNSFRNYTQRYQYDAVGNILQMSHHFNNTSRTRKYQYAFDDSTQPVSNRLWRTWQGSGGYMSTTANKKVTYSYDSHGSMLNLANVSNEFKMLWDHRDMIASINLGGGGYAHYQYDTNKQRTRKVIIKNNIVEERIYLGGLEVYRRTENGKPKDEIETLHLFDGEQRLLMVDQIIKNETNELGIRNLYRYTLSNHLGSSSIELDEETKLISYEEYHPYGTSSYRAGRNEAEVKLKRYRYTGMERDEESGLSYHTARYYLPWLGRWGSADPIGTLSNANLYAYAQLNPIIWTDENGLDDKKRVGGVWGDLKYDDNGNFLGAYSQSPEGSKKAGIDRLIEWAGHGDRDKNSADYWISYIGFATDGKVSPSKKTSDIQLFIIAGGREGFLDLAAEDHNADSSTTLEFLDPSTPRLFENQDTNDLLVALKYEKAKGNFSLVTTVDLIIPNKVPITTNKFFTAAHQTLYERWQSSNVYTKGHEFRLFDKKGKVREVVPYQELFIPGLKPYVAIHGQVGTLGCVQIGSTIRGGKSEVTPLSYEDSILKKEHIIFHPTSLLRLLDAADVTPMDRRPKRIGLVQVIR